MQKKKFLEDKFVNYCQEEDRKNVEKIRRSKKITIKTDENDYEDGSGDIENQTNLYSNLTRKTDKPETPL